ERWVDDVLHGPYEVFDASGEPLFRGAFDRGQLQGEALVRQRDPRLGLWVREVVNYVGGRLQGPVLGYYENQDTRWRELHYVDGVATGTLRQWWPNENPQLEVELAWGLWQGLMRSWHEQGGEAERCGFVLGLREGPCTRFWDNGQKKAEGTYRHNLKAPGWLYWDREGRPLTSPPDGEHEGV
ncbi:MAG TPA: hypothetical protein PK095_24045, partial [Myxococcota bacterium]|nr:hypothetical protein [Myxococcota bacterium]